MKEAYTKALGIGLGFDFSKVEFDVVRSVVRIDGKVPKGWKFSKFVVHAGEDLYEGVVAEYIGGEDTVVVSEVDPHDWLVSYDAVTFVEDAINTLQRNP